MTSDAFIKFSTMFGIAEEVMTDNRANFVLETVVTLPLARSEASHVLSIPTPDLLEVKHLKSSSYQPPTC